MSALTTSSFAQPVWVYLGLGSNLNNPPLQLKEGLKLIESEFELEDLEVSSMVKTPPMGGKQQPDYFNLVCRFKSDHSPMQILKTIQKIEDARGRTREEHWGSRTLDIDILLIGDFVCEETELSLPHPGASKRNFVIGPLLELDPKLVDPKVGLSYQHLWDSLSKDDQTSMEKVI